MTNFVLNNFSGPCIPFPIVQARGLGIRLVTPSPADAEAARGVQFRSRHKGFHTGEKAKMAVISGESIFGADKESSAQARRKAVLIKTSRLGIKTKGMRLLEPGVTTATRAAEEFTTRNRSSGSSRRRSSASAAEVRTYRTAVPSHRHGSSKKRQRQEGTEGISASNVDHAMSGDSNVDICEAIVEGGAEADANHRGEMTVRRRKKAEVQNAARASPRKKSKNNVVSSSIPSSLSGDSSYDSRTGGREGDGGGLAAIAGLY